MNRFKITLPIAALVLGVAFSAFTQKAEEKSSAPQETLYWFSSPYNGSNYEGMATKPDEASATGCNASGPECERGFRQNQLVNGDPAQGVISTQKNLHVDIIRQP